MKEVTVKRGESIIISIEDTTITIRPYKPYTKAHVCTRVHVYTKNKDTLTLRVKYKKS